MTGLFWASRKGQAGGGLLFVRRGGQWIPDGRPRVCGRACSPRALLRPAGWAGADEGAV